MHAVAVLLNEQGELLEAEELYRCVSKRTRRSVFGFLDDGGVRDCEMKGGRVCLAK